ncbi:hypothetical protein [Methylobacterium planeticum]|uniref:Uncharacterized protein n=1 Tax=Methylobacterium planeticum TaxID=2615211 RepID=A0A6N6MNF7_9HYPH|nr:hypothetical protein [Methylobacterium planeticum]KAB1071716.1 hypothetical protein F6X51_18035 [Methylobacterium planeticum]
MLTLLRNFLTNTRSLEASLHAELRAMEERLSRRMFVIEQRLDANEQALRQLGHKVARLEGRASVLAARIANEENDPAE